MSVNRERVRLLVDALRSGEFAQGRGTLTRVDVVDGETKHCCLGVGCVVAKRNGCAVGSSGPRTHLGDSGTKYFDPATVKEGGWYGDESESHMPQIVLDWYGFDRQPQLKFADSEAVLTAVTERVGHDVLTSAYLNSDGTTDAVDANDDLKLTFAEIADAFEFTYLRDETPEVTGP